MRHANTFYKGAANPEWPYESYCVGCGQEWPCKGDEKVNKRQAVYSAIDSEREYQDRKWGGMSHDEHESIGNFLIYIERYLQKAKDTYIDAGHSPAALHEVRKVAAIAVACMEVHGAPLR